MVAYGHVAAAAKIDPLYSPGGVSMHPRLIVVLLGALKSTL